MKRLILFLVGIISGLSLTAQQTATVFGAVRDAVTERPVEFVTVYVDGETEAAESNAKGQYTLDVPADKEFTIIFSRVGYAKASQKIQAMPAQSSRRINVRLASMDVGVEVVVTESRIEDKGMVKENVKELKLLPTTTGNLESVLPSIALGTSSGTGGELSSQYNVRGGNYDENLVYVNDFEIYRPQLIRSGQQEGLTFPNIDLMSTLSFSSGGFEARYGDKMSSVLDVKYKRPDSLKASIGMSMLGGSAHVEGSLNVGKDRYQKLRYLIGARYKTTRYLLGSLDVTGEYTPNFTDIQSYITYDFNRDWQLGVLANFNKSVYQFKPATRNTATGLIDFALQLSTAFEGQEVDDFTTAMGGVSLTYLPDRDYNPFFLKFLASSYASSENERIDIIGRYSLRQIETDLGSDQFGEILQELGTGTQHQYVRNFLESNVTNVEHKGGLELQNDDYAERKSSSHFLQWSVKYQHEFIDDEINEWERLDSAGYSLNYDTTAVQLFSVLKTANTLESNRLSASFQDTYSWEKDSVAEVKFSLGARASYWDLNKDWHISPRAQLLYRPLKKSNTISYRMAGGLYYQPPFYRELRDKQGVVDSTVVAQKSAHLVLGLTKDFYWEKLSKKPFKLILEAYYKELWDLISYDVENVRIRYSGANDATGYVTGVDLRINGEFVPGAESWFNISFLRARESLNGVDHLKRYFEADSVGQAFLVEEVVNDVPRPTDRFMNLSIFFQDYLPRNENFKMHLNMTVGGGLPYGLLNNNEVYRNTFRFPIYQRVDIGFAIQLWEKDWLSRKPNHPLRFAESTWLSLEIFNLLKVQNVASNTWIKTVFQQQYAIPNYLTSRRINLRLKMDF